MRKFATTRLDVHEHEDGVVELGGLKRPLPRGLYRIAFRTDAGDGDHLVELGYAATGLDNRCGVVRLWIRCANGRAAATFVIPEEATDFRIKTADRQLFAGTQQVRLARLSSVVSKLASLAYRASSQLSQPSQLPRLARDAVGIVSRHGIGGLIRAVDASPQVMLVEQRIEQRYRDWARREESRIEAGREQLEAHAAALSLQPKFSIIMPVYNPPPDVFREAVESVRRQFWPHWELCIADDASSDMQVRSLIEALAAEEPRIKAVFRDRNGHISEASNSALALASGDWLGFLDQDDLLAPNALYEIARTINAHPQAKLVYSDEDMIGERGERCQPRFKPDWNLDLMLSSNFINHLWCVRTSLVSEAGGFRRAYDGAQDYDLLLRVVERLRPGQIEHVGKVLYHWRMSATSIAHNPEAKPYTRLSSERALSDYCHRNGLAGKVRLTDGSFHVVHALPSPPPRVSIVIATRDRLELLDKCVTSIREKTDYPDYEIIVVDNGSRQDATLAWLARMEAEGAIRTLRQDGEFNYSALNNAGVAAAEGEIVALLNNDMEVISAGWLGEMVAVCLQPGVGVVGAKLYFPNGTIQHAGITVTPDKVSHSWFSGFPGDYRGPQSRLMRRQRVSAVIGACLVTHRALYREVGGLDEIDFPVDYNDVDYCLKVERAGHRVVFTPHAELIHHESASRGKHVTPAKAESLYRAMALMKRKWGDRLNVDPWSTPGMPAELGRIDGS
ncbi:MAG: glycosyltransferase family 2 protein [Nitratireductor sp.]|nr:glycosyltransferase family 2 protein [Nitratireductor sp.]